MLVDCRRRGLLSSLVKILPQVQKDRDSPLKRNWGRGPQARSVRGKKAGKLTLMGTAGNATPVALRHGHMGHGDDGRERTAHEE